MGASLKRAWVPSWTLWPGLAITVLILAIALMVLFSLLQDGASIASSIFQEDRLWRVTVFTFKQAALSVVLSAALALPAARALARRPHWPGRRLILALSAIALIIPTTVAALGLLAVWGRSGWIMAISTGLGLTDQHLEIYGLGGILLGHVFFNAPLMMRVFLAAIEGIPSRHWRLAAELGMRSRDIFRLIEWPALKTVLPGAAGLVFLLCFTSFAMVLMLGGGPAASTLEVSIYTAIRFDFDLPLAALLSCWQMMICMLVILLLAAGRTDWPDVGAALQNELRPDLKRLGGRLADGASLALYVLLIVLPVLAVLWRGFNPDAITLFGQSAFIEATLTSLAIALASSVATLILAWSIAEARRTLLAPARFDGQPPARTMVAVIDAITSIYLALPAIVFGTGMFLLVRRFANPSTIAPLLVITANILLALPFALRILQGRLLLLARRHDPLCQSLGIRGWHRLYLVDLPSMRRELGFAGGLTAALSMGDLGVIALFGSTAFQTLPWLLYQTMNRYRADEAAAMALLLLLFSIGLFGIWHLICRPVRRSRRS